MSRSNNTELYNPAKKFFQWDSDNKQFNWYNKETKKKVPVPLPFTFIVLDYLVTIKGFNDAEQSGFYSNEIRSENLKKDILVVRDKKGVAAAGLYEQVIHSADCTGAQFCQSVYIAYKEDKQLVIGNIAFTGCSLGAFFDFKKSNKLLEISCQVKTFLPGKKGKVEFNSPVFNALPVSEETNQKAIELDKELQEYLSKYLAIQKQRNSEASVESIVSDGVTNTRSTQSHVTSQEELEAEHLMRSESGNMVAPIHSDDTEQEPF
jgi:hypothetical protein